MNFPLLRKGLSVCIAHVKSIVFLIDMEIKVYLSMDLYNKRKCVYCGRVFSSSSVQLDFKSILYTMRCLYGSSAIVEFLVVS